MKVRLSKDVGDVRVEVEGDDSADALKKLYVALEATCKALLQVKEASTPDA